MKRAAAVLLFAATFCFADSAGLDASSGFPAPWVDKQACGWALDDTPSSALCDPEGVLSSSGREDVRDAVEQALANTVTCNGKQEPLRVGVAVTRKLTTSWYSFATSNDKLKMEQAATATADRWVKASLDPASAWQLSEACDRGNWLIIVLALEQATMKVTSGSAVSIENRDAIFSAMVPDLKRGTQSHIDAAFVRGIQAIPSSIRSTDGVSRRRLGDPSSFDWQVCAALQGSANADACQKCGEVPAEEGSEMIRPSKMVDGRCITCLPIHDKATCGNAGYTNGKCIWANGRCNTCKGREQQNCKDVGCNWSAGSCGQCLGSTQATCAQRGCTWRADKNKCVLCGGFLSSEDCRDPKLGGRCVWEGKCVGNPKDGLDAHEDVPLIVSIVIGAILCIFCSCCIFACFCCSGGDGEGRSDNDYNNNSTCGGGNYGGGGG